MITQYTRIIIDDTSGDIVGATSQDYPFADGWQPIGIVPGQTARDYEIDVDLPSSDFTLGKAQQLIRAREMIDNLELVAGVLAVRSGADVRIAAKILKISTEKPIEETPVRIELATFIDAELIKGGSSEAELLDLMRERDPTTPNKISDLSTVQLVRIKSSF